ncbi:MAG: hypothetical protein AB2A00_20955 [Myxococcota bacterium]
MVSRLPLSPHWMVPHPEEEEAEELELDDGEDAAEDDPVSDEDRDPLLDDEVRRLPVDDEELLALELVVFPEDAAPVDPLAAELLAVDDELVAADALDVAPPDELAPGDDDVVDVVAALALEVEADAEDVEAPLDETDEDVGAAPEDAPGSTHVPSTQRSPASAAQSASDSHQELVRLGRHAAVKTSNSAAPQARGPDMRGRMLPEVKPVLHVRP